MGNGTNSSTLFTNHHDLYPVELDDAQIKKSGTHPSDNSDNNASNGSTLPSFTTAELGSTPFGTALDPDPHAWMSNATKLSYHRDLRNLALSHARIIYGSDRARYFDVITTHFVSGSKVNYGAFLVVTADGTTKILRKELAECPLAATRALVAGLTNDVGVLFTKFDVGDKFDGQQGGRNSSGIFELGINPEFVDNTHDLIRTYVAPRGPRGAGYGGDRKRLRLDVGLPY